MSIIKIVSTDVTTISTPEVGYNKIFADSTNSEHITLMDSNRTLMDLNLGSGNKYDFDIIVWQTIYVERKEYIRNVKTLYDSVSSIKEYFRNNVIDEFGNPVIIDFFFIAVDPQIEDYREIKITK